MTKSRKGKLSLNNPYIIIGGLILVAVVGYMFIKKKGSSEDPAEIGLANVGPTGCIPPKVNIKGKCVGPILLNN